MPEEYADSLPEGYTRIHKGVAYDDMAFRRFFERYKDEEWFRRTIFVFTADHVSSEKFAEESLAFPGNMRIMGFIYTPDGALRGTIREVAQQLDLMPTLLGLLGNREPYFAFGRDVLNEPERPRWSVSYGGGNFRAVTGDATLLFDEEQATVEPRTDSGCIPSAGDTPDAAALLPQLKALIQQYYTRIERKDYTVGGDNTLHTDD